MTSVYATNQLPKPIEHRVEVEGFLSKPLVIETKITKSVIGSKPKQNNFSWGWCTYYVASLVEVPWHGNARDWLRNAQVQGYTTGDEPLEGSIVVTSESSLGHVALVTKVNGDKVSLREMNYTGFGIVSERTISKNERSIRGYIY